MTDDKGRACWRSNRSVAWRRALVLHLVTFAVCLVATPAFACQEAIVERSEEFWSAFRIDAEWVEYHPTIEDLAASADIVALATITDIQPWRVHGSAPDGVVTEDRIVFRIDRLLGGDAPGCGVSLGATSNVPLTDELREELRALLPLHPVLIMLRKRQDEDVYALVNGFGLWTPTLRSPVDCAIELYPDFCSWFLGGDAESVQELADRVTF